MVLSRQLFLGISSDLLSAIGRKVGEAHMAHKDDSGLLIGGDYE